MNQRKITPRELWARQEIRSCDVDYNFWNKKREEIQAFARISQHCIFTVDVFKERYDFASENFSNLLGYSPTWLKKIRKQGDLLEEKIHPDDRKQLTELQVEHGNFIYSLSPEFRNDYRQIFQFRMQNAKGQYIHVTSRQQVIAKDKQGKAWMVMGVVDVSTDQILTGKVKRILQNIRTGEISTSTYTQSENRLTSREKEILVLIRKGYFSKEIADKLNVSIYTVNNHRKNILAKLNAANVMEVLDKLGYSEILL